jgi:hypothetical protein
MNFETQSLASRAAEPGFNSTLLPTSPHSAITPENSDYRWKCSKENGRAISNPAIGLDYGCRING